MIRAWFITGAVVLALLAVLAGVGKPARWPAAETPPQQGEAALAAAGGARPVQVQAHAVWHVLAAAALGWAGRFLAVESGAEKVAEKPAAPPASRS